MSPSILETFDVKITSVELTELPAVEKVQVDESIHEYRVYKRRWIGLVALFLLNVSAGMLFRLYVCWAGSECLHHGHATR